MKRILCLLLAALMLLSLAACNTGDTETETTGSGNGGGDKTETADPDYVMDKVDSKFDNKTVTFLYNNSLGVADEFKSNGPSKAIVENAVYLRNEKVQDLLKVKLNYLSQDGDEAVKTALAKNVQAGYSEGDSYDLVSNGTFMSVGPVIEGHYRNLNSTKYVNTEKKYWTQGFNDIVTFGEDEKQYLATGALAISLFRYMYVTVYNKDLFERYDKADLYNTVMDGEWTLDKQLELIKDTYSPSAGGGGGTKTEDDFYGFITGSQVAMDPYTVASDIHLIVKDPDTKTWEYNNEIVGTLSDMVDKLHLVLKDQSAYLFSGDDVNTTEIIDKFAKGEALMATVSIYALEQRIDNIDFNYGLAPMPKYQKSQGNKDKGDLGYRTYVQDKVTAVGIPTHVPESRWDMVSAVMEALAYTSYETVLDAYYNKALSLRYMKDPQAKEVLGVIYDSLSFDFANSCSNCLSNFVIRDSLRKPLSGDGSLTQVLQSNKGKISNDLRTLNRNIARME